MAGLDTGWLCSWKTPPMQIWLPSQQNPFLEHAVLTFQSLPWSRQKHSSPNRAKCYSLAQPPVMTWPVVTCQSRHVSPLCISQCVPAFLVNRVCLPRNRHLSVSLSVSPLSLSLSISFIYTGKHIVPVRGWLIACVAPRRPLTRFPQMC